MQPPSCGSSKPTHLPVSMTSHLRPFLTVNLLRSVDAGTPANAQAHPPYSQSERQQLGGLVLHEELCGHMPDCFDRRWAPGASPAKIPLDRDASCLYKP